MTDQEINIAIAEACPEVAEIDKDNGGAFWKRPDSYVRFNPANDLNAMHEAEKTLTPDQKDEYARRLCDINCCMEMSIEWDCASATARQRAEAFLKTIGKWKE